MPVVIEVQGAKAIAYGPFKIEMLGLFAGLRGKKTWNKSHSVEFDATPANMQLIKNAEFEFPDEFKFKQPKLIEDVFETLATQHATIKEPVTAYKPLLPLFAHQKKAVALSWDRPAYALLLEMGLGKTAILITNAGMLHKAGKLTGVLVLSPKGVHLQWVDEQLPLHMDASVKYNAIKWRKQTITLKEMNKKGLTFLSMNIDAIRTPLGMQTATNFLKLHNGKSAMFVDESHLIKSPGADRTKAAIALGRLARYRRISTGTPIARNIMDAWAQFMFLNVDILGHKYATSFRARYCIMGGFEGRQIVGQRNVEEFYQLIAPHSYRLTKAEALDLPPKIYIKREYEIGERTKQHYKEIKKTFMTELDSGNIVDVANAAVALLRLQQVVCGYLPYTDEVTEEKMFEVFSEERLEVLLEIVEQVNGPVLVWARFVADIERIAETLRKAYGLKSVVTYYGATKTKDRKASVELFLNGKARFFVSNPSAGGTGLNLQGDCQTVIYYSNSFNALHRWQSEDRVHRMGTKGTVTYFDIVAVGTIDRAILGNLRNKKGISDLTFDEIRSLIATA